MLHMFRTYLRLRRLLVIHRLLGQPSRTLFERLRYGTDLVDRYDMSSRVLEVALHGNQTVAARVHHDVVDVLEASLLSG